MEKMFEKASKQKLRFATTKGLLTTEDLWELKLEDLDTLARGINTKIKSEGEESFITTKKASNTELDLKLEILKYVIKVKLEAKEAAKTRAEKASKIAQLRAALMEDETKELLSMSKEDKLKMLAELEG